MKTAPKTLAALALAGVFAATSALYAQAPHFTVQPAPTSLMCYPDARMTFRPVAESASPIDYRWQTNTIYVPGATSSNVTIAALGLAAGNTYTLTLEASNGLGLATSDPVTVTVVTKPPAIYTLYQDAFSDAGNVPLNGRQPNVSPGCVGWTAGSGMYVTNGILPYPGHWENYLPFTPQWGHVYSFSVDVNVLTGGQNWLAMGFVNSPNVSSGGFYVGATAWMLMRGDRSGLQTFDNGFGGAASYGPEWYLDPTGFTTFTMVLDTTTGDTNANTGWTLSFAEDGVLLGTNPYHVYAGNPANTFLGIGGSDGVTGEFDNLLVTDSVIGSTAPTPPSILPAAVEVYSNSPVSFSATTAGACPIYYQWRLGNTDLKDATNATLELPSVSATQAGSYYVLVSNRLGTALSPVPSTLTVIPDPVQAFTLCQDSFTGLGGTPLDGRNPEINYLGQAWSADPRMIVDTNQLFCPGETGVLNSGAFLPFIPVSGHVYVLAVDMNPLTGGGNWFDLGFTPDPDVNKVAPDLGGGPWLLQRADRSGSQCFNLGYGSVGSGDGGNATGYTTWKIVLDTTTGDTNANTGWTATFVEGRPGSFGKIITKCVYGPNPLIYFASLGVASGVGASGNFDNFRLTDSVAPLSIAISGGNVTVSWPQGTLLEAPALRGPWTTNSAVSPYTLTPTGPQKFYRVQLQ